MSQIYINIFFAVEYTLQYGHVYLSDDLKWHCSQIMCPHE